MDIRQEYRDRERDRDVNFVRRFVFYGLLALIAIAPLPFGSNRPWAWSILSLWVGILVLLDATASLVDPVRGESRFMRRIAIPAILYILVVIWIVIQASADILPASAHPMWGEAAAQLGRDLGGYISIEPELTRDALMVLVAYAGVFWLAARQGRDRANAATMLKFFVIVSTSYAIYGLAVFFGGWEKILWYEKSAYRGDVTSTFINHNSYATYAAIGLVVSVVFFVKIFARDFLVRGNTRQVIRKLTDKALGRIWLPVIGVMTNGTALMLAHSRAGFVSGMVGVAVTLLGIRLAQILPKRTGNAMILGLLFMAIGGWVASGGKLEQRFAHLEGAQDTRLSIYEKVVEATTLSPLTGYGYGTFEPAFRPFKDYATGNLGWNYAHNSYLEFVFGAGMLASSLMFLAISLISVTLALGIKRRRRDQIFSVAALGVVVLTLMHSVVDFSIQIVAMGVSFCFLAGLGWAQAVGKNTEL